MTEKRATHGKVKKTFQLLYKKSEGEFFFWVFSRTLGQANGQGFGLGQANGEVFGLGQANGHAKVSGIMKVSSNRR